MVFLCMIKRMWKDISIDAKIALGLVVWLGISYFIGSIIDPEEHLMMWMPIAISPLVIIGLCWFIHSSYISVMNFIEYLNKIYRECSNK